jgi:hypothetical protein
MLYAFDLLELDGADLRALPLGERKARLAKLLVRKPIAVAIVFNEHTDEDGAIVFRHACKLGLEGIVSKRLSAPYRSGPSREHFESFNLMRFISVSTSDPASLYTAAQGNCSVRRSYISINEDPASHVALLSSIQVNDRADVALLGASGFSLMSSPAPRSGLSRSDLVL